MVQQRVLFYFILLLLLFYYPRGRALAADRWSSRRGKGKVGDLGSGLITDQGQLSHSWYGIGYSGCLSWGILGIMILGGGILGYCGYCRYSRYVSYHIICVGRWLVWINVRWLSQWEGRFISYGGKQIVRYSLTVWTRGYLVRKVTWKNRATVHQDSLTQEVRREFIRVSSF